MRFSILSILIALTISPNLWGQDEPILLNNPSFESFPRAGEVGRFYLNGWYDCGFPSESAPDVQPGHFQVTQTPFEGESFLGLVVRDNDTYERVSQRLSSPIQKDKCYEFSMYIARSLIYLSPTKRDTVQVNHVSPARLRIWGGSGYCGKQELLAETSVIINSRWLQYNFKFEPRMNHTYIMLEAFYKTPVLFPYNGNILLDHASPIIPIPCDVELPEAPVDPTELIAEEVDDPEPVVEETPVTPAVPEPQPPVVDNSTTPNSDNPPQEEKILKELDRQTLKKGQTIRIDKLYFPADQTVFTDNSYGVLDEIYSFLNSYPDVTVEIGGHTNTIPEHDYCDRLSTSRAKSVVDYLINKGIAENRLEYKGYGKRQPLFRDKYDRAARKKNQRVEIKILSIDG